MAKGNFEKLLKPLLGIEGGVADRDKKADPGGLTNKGVTWKVYNAYRETQGLPARSVREITLAEATEIYREQYWMPIRGDDLPNGIDWCMFDMAVNSGPSRAVKTLQKVLGCNVDGVVGLNTLKGVTAGDNAAIINHYCDERLRFMRGLKNWGPNKNGWRNRVELVRASALSMLEASSPFALRQLTAQAKDLPNTAKAPEGNLAVTKSPEGIGLGMLTAGFSGEKVRQAADIVHLHATMDTVIGRAAFVVFGALMAFGGLLWLVAFVKRGKERGQFGGFIGAVFK